MKQELRNKIQLNYPASGLMVETRFAVKGMRDFLFSFFCS